MKEGKNLSAAWETHFLSYLFLCELTRFSFTPLTQNPSQGKRPDSSVNSSIHSICSFIELDSVTLSPFFCLFMLWFFSSVIRSIRVFFFLFLDLCQNFFGISCEDLIWNSAPFAQVRVSYLF